MVVLDDGSGGASAPMPDGVRVWSGATLGSVALVCRVAREEGVASAVHFAGKSRSASGLRCRTY